MGEDMKHLSLANSDRPAIIDDSDLEKVSGKTWRLIKVSNGAQYVGWKSHKNGKDVTVYLHRFVMGNPKGKMIDHINGDPFDNRRENLRASTNSQNQMNSKGKAHSSVYKNVYWNKKLGKWKAQIDADGQTFFFGYFENERHAALVVDLNLPILHGEFARLKFSADLVRMSFYAPGLNHLSEAPHSAV
jgi:hypothetical protein